MNLSDLKDRVFRMTNNIYNDAFHMRDLINTAMTLLADEAKLESVSPITVTSGTAEYPLPTLYKSPRLLVEGTADNPCETYNLVPIEEVYCGYAIWDGNIILKPAPSRDITLNFYYYRYPTALQNDLDNADSEFDGYGEVIASYAAAMILSLPNVDASKNMADRYFGIWEDGKQRFKRARAKQNKQNSVRVVTYW